MKKKEKKKKGEDDWFGRYKDWLKLILGVIVSVKMELKMKLGYRFENIE